MKIIKLNSSDNNSIPIKDIVAGCLEGKPYCQELLFKRYAPLVMTFCRRYEHPSYGAKDILQDTFVSVFANIERYDEEKGSLEAWMKGISINIALNVIRKRKIKFTNDEVELTADDNFQNNHFGIELLSEEYLLKVIQDLPLGYRTVFNMYIMDGFTHKEIAQILNIKEQTSKSQLSKAKKMLRNILPKNGVKEARV